MQALPPDQAPIPGSARDDIERLKMLFQRFHDQDLTTLFEVMSSPKRPGVGWKIVILSGGLKVERSAATVSEAITAYIEELSRRILLRWRADGGILQLAGMPPTPFDVEPTVVDVPQGDASIVKRG